MRLIIVVICLFTISAISGTEKNLTRAERNALSSARTAPKAISEPRAMSATPSGQVQANVQAAAGPDRHIRFKLACDTVAEYVDNYNDIGFRASNAINDEITLLEEDGYQIVRVSDPSVAQGATLRTHTASTYSTSYGWTNATICVTISYK